MQPVTWTKQILRDGNGTTPQLYQEVNLTVLMRYLPDELVCEGNQVFRIVVGRGDTLPALEEAIRGMSVGEQSCMTIPAGLINDASIECPIVEFEKGKDLVVEAQIKSLGRVLQPDECLGFDYRTERAKELRSAGNELMKQKKYQEASQVYKNGYELVELDTGSEVDQSKILLLSNLSQAYLNCKVTFRLTKDYQKCVEICTKVLNDSPENQKLLYRRATGLKFLGKFDEAIGDAQTAIKLSGSSEEFVQLLEDIRKHQQESLKKQKAVYSKMFG